MANILQFPQSRATSGKEPIETGAPQRPMSLQERIEYDRATLEQMSKNVKTLPIAADVKADLAGRIDALLEVAAGISQRAGSQVMPVAAPGFAADLSRLEDAMQDVVDAYQKIVPGTSGPVPKPVLRGIGSVGGMSGGMLAWGLVTAGTIAIASSIYMLLRRRPSRARAAA